MSDAIDPKKPARRKRDAVPNRLRFEVFKRDGFTCVYCGARPPGVVLNADHVVPVVDGGPTDLANLVTACATCNNGKGPIPLEVAAEVHTRTAALERAREVAEIDAAFNDYLREQREVRKGAVDRLAAYWNEAALRGYWHLSDYGKASIGRFLGPMVEEEIMQAMDIAITRMPFPNIDPKWSKTGAKWKAASDLIDRRFRYFCGVCHNVLRERKSAP